MPEGIRERINKGQQQVKEKVNKKLQPYFRLYRTYIVISILLGASFKYGYDGFVSLIKPLLDALHLSSMVPISVVAINNSYLFSTSAAILATIFTIIFVLLTVFIQISDTDSSADIFQSNEMKNLLRLYFATIVLSLMMLETTFQFPILVLTLTFACILSLYPFLNNLSDKLVYDVGLKNRSKKMFLLIASNDEVSTISEIIPLSNIGKRAIQKEQLFYFKSVMSVFSTSIYMVEQHKMIKAIKEFGDQYLYVLSFLVIKNPITDNRKEMTELLLREIRRYMHSYTNVIKSDSLDYQMFLLKPIGIYMIKSGFDDSSVRKVINLLWSSFYYIMEDENIDIIEELEREDLKDTLVKYLGEMAKESFNYNRENPFTFSVALLWKIGAELFQAEKEFNRPISPTLLSTMVEQLNEIEKLIEADLFQKKYKESIIQPFNEQNKTYLDEFKELYDERKRR